ncbi:histidine phosphatase family protein [candidate division KSB1 bacterium]|nr:histidine phosphatase family protein [candidate division KSB1 bacterium]
MRTLFLIRHAKSSWKNPDQVDFDRPLNKRGKHDAPLMGRLLAEKGITPDCVLCSPAKRARRTLAPIRKTLNLQKTCIEFRDEIYGSDWQELIGLLHQLNDKLKTVFLIGHNPGLSDLAEVLAGAGIDTIPTCGVAVIDLQTVSWSTVEPGSGILRDLLLPRDLA